MARELKDQLLGQSAPVDPQTGKDSSVKPAQPGMPSIQIPTDENLEHTLVRIIKEDWEASKTARGKLDYGLTAKGEVITFEVWLKRIRDLYTGKREAKPIPWKFCSNRSLRIATAILDLLHARLYPAVVSEDLLKWKPGDITDVPKVERIEKLMRWWIWVRSRMREFFDNWVKVVIGYGDGVTESSWKVTHYDSGKTDQIPIQDQSGQPMLNPDGTPAVSQQRRIETFESTTSKVYLKEHVFLQEGSRDLQTEPVILEDTYFYRELEEGEAQDKFKNITSLLKEKLPVPEAVGGGLDPQTAQDIRNIKLRNHPVKILKWYGNFDADKDGYAENVRILISPEYDLYLGGVAVKDLTKTGKRPLSFAKFESRLDRPDVNDGEGVIEKVWELAEEIDAIFNQLTDANTLSVLRPGFYDPGGDVDAPVLKLAPNRITPISDPTRNITFPDITIQITNLITAVRLVLEFVERLTAASSYVLGRESEIVGGSGTATRTNAIVQSAEQRFALPAERLRRGASEIIRQHLDLLQLNIPPGLETRVLGEKGEPLFQPNELTQMGIEGDYDAYLTEDPAQGSKQTERELANMLYTLLLQNPLVMSDPVKIYKVTADILKANGKDPVEYLGPEPQTDNVDDPADENTLMVQGDFGRVVPQMAENHLLHIQKHTELLQSPSLAALPPHLSAQISQFAMQHIQQHQQMMQVMMGIMQKFGGKSNAGTGTKQGGASGQSGEPKGLPIAPGMENLSGPLGAALNTKREGQGGIPA